MQVLRKDWRFRAVGFDRPILRDRLFYLAAVLALALGSIVLYRSHSLIHGVLTTAMTFPWIGVGVGSVRAFVRGLRGRDWRHDLRRSHVTAGARDQDLAQFCGSGHAERGKVGEM